MALLDALKKGAKTTLRTQSVLKPTTVGASALLLNKVLTPKFQTDPALQSQLTQRGITQATPEAVRAQTVLKSPTPVASTTSATSRPVSTPSTQMSTPTQSTQTNVAPLNAITALREQNATPRPITPAPTTVKGTAPEDVSELGIAKKLLKNQYGDTFTDAELELLAKRQLEKPKQDVSALEKAQQTYLDTLSKQSESSLQRMRDEEARLEQRRNEQLAKYEEQLRAQAQADIEEARRVGQETQTTEERLLGARGNLTSAVGANRISDIQRQTSNTVSAVNARTSAQRALKQAELEGADAEVIQSLRENYDAALEKENTAVLEAETNLQNAKLAAAQAGDEAFLNLVQSSLDSLSVEKAAKADAQLTKNIGDGYIYDELGQRIKDAEGKLITYQTPEEFDEFMNVGGQVFNKTTGTFVEPSTTGNMVLGTNLSEQIKTVGNVLDSANFIANNPNLDKYVGTVQSRLPVLDKDRQDFINKFEQIVASQTLDNLGLMKGVLTDRDVQILRDAATSMSLKGSEQELQRQITQYRDTLARKASEALANATGQSQKEIEDALKSGAVSVQDVVSELEQSFNTPAGTGSTTSVSSIKDGTKVASPFGKGVATGIEAGSKFWKYGLDLALEGGKGAPVPTPVSGTVVSAGTDGGFGNSVKVRLDDGRVVRLSHLNDIRVKPGQTITAGTVVGGQGNTGKTYGKTGIHLDVTIYDQNGKPYSSQQVAQLLGVQAMA